MVFLISLLTNYSQVRVWSEVVGGTAVSFTTVVSFTTILKVGNFNLGETVVA